MQSVPPVAIIAMSALLPGGHGPARFWRSVIGAEDHVTEIPPTHWRVRDYFDPDPAAPDKTYAARGAFLAPVAFDPVKYGIPPVTLQATDTSQLLALIAAEDLLSAISPAQAHEMDRDRVSVILGTSALELLTTMAGRTQRPLWFRALQDAGIDADRANEICDRISAQYVPWQEASFPGLLTNVVAGRIANKFDLHGSNYTTDAACASSLAALSSALNHLAVGQADLVICGGVDTLNDPFMYTCFSKTPALSPTEDCRPFSDCADGMVLGEGVVMFALKRLADAERDGDRIHAVIRGLGSSSDGRGTSIYAPLVTGQSRALRRAYESAGYGQETVELVEAHGTGTTAGDIAEFTALSTVFNETGGDARQWCALGSVKSQIGHTKNTAGAVGLLKAVLAVQHKVLPPTIKIERPNPKLDLPNSPFYLNTQARPWISDGDHPRRAGVSSFGFGGTNFHVTVEEYTGAAAAPRMRANASELIVISADEPAEMASRCRALAADPAPLTSIAQQAQLIFDHSAAVRLAAVVTTRDELRTRLTAAAARIDAEPDSPFVEFRELRYSPGQAEAGRIAFLFPGQGSQYVGMGSALAMTFPAALSVWDAIAQIPVGDQPLHRVVFPPPAFTDDERSAQRRLLDQTEWAQPALAAHELALMEVLRMLELVPDAVAGHSFGELVALHAAGCYDLGALVRLARRRGELMRDAAATPGAMLALTASIDDVRRLLNGSGDVSVANHNAPDQVVVSGTAEGIDRFGLLAGEHGLPVMRLNVSTAFHSPVVAGAAEHLRVVLGQTEIGEPRIDVYSNDRADRYPNDPDAVRDRLAEHLQSPVRFVEQIEAMYADGVRTFIEVGPGAVLSRLTDRILGNREHTAVVLDRASGDGVTALHKGLAQLACDGVAMNYEALWPSFEPDPWEIEVADRSATTVEITGANYGKPYPPVNGTEPRPAQLPPAQLPPAQLPPAQLPPQEMASASPRPAQAMPAAPALPERQFAGTQGPRTPTAIAPPPDSLYSPAATHSAQVPVPAA